mgnify:CR=1 FL=1
MMPRLTVFLIILAALPTQLALIGLAESEHEISTALGLRKIAVTNPLPYQYVGLAEVNATFTEREALNNTITVLDPHGETVPIQLVNCSFYPSSNYYRSCRIIFPVNVPPLSMVEYTLQCSPYPIANISSPEGLRVRLANLSLTISNVTGTFVANLSNALIVENSRYRFIFTNESLVAMEFSEFTSPNLVYCDWPLMGFAALKNRTVTLSPYNFSKCRVRLLINGSLLTIVEQECWGEGVKLRQLFYFTAPSTLVRVDSRLTIVDAKYLEALYYPLLRLYGLKSFKELLLNRTIVDPTRARSFVPAPKWLAIGDGEGWLVLWVNYTPANLSVVIDRLEEELRERQLSGSLRVRRRSSELLRVLDNASLVLRAEDYVKKGLLNTTSLRARLRYLNSSLDAYSVILANMTEMLEEPDTTCRRLLILPEDQSLNLAYQLNTSSVVVNATLLLSYTTEDPAEYVGKHVLANTAGVSIFYVPIAAKLETPRSAFIDDFLNVTTVITAFSRVENLTVTLNYPESLGKLVYGNSTYNFTVFDGTIELRWVLYAVYEGEWHLRLNITCDRGSLLIERVLNVTIPSIIPRTVIPRYFNLSIACLDVLGRPLSGYMVNLYENKSRVLIGSAVTNESGLVEFSNISRGVYLVEVTDGLYRTEDVVYLFRNQRVSILIKKARLTVRVELDDGSPLPLTLIYVRDENGSLTCVDFTNSSGIAVCKALPLGNYTVSARWRGSIVGYSKVSLKGDSMLTMRGLVKKVRVNVLMANKPAPGARIYVYSTTGRLEAVLRSNDEGVAVVYLLPGVYKFKAVKGQYYAEAIIDTRVSRTLVLKLEISSNLWVLLGLTALLWTLTAYVWHRKTSYIYKERERYRRMLQRLEELHDKGVIEDKYYVKLKQEYEERLNELSRGELA